MFVVFLGVWMPTVADDSEITLNFALNEDYDGGELVFYGLRGTPESRAKEPEAEVRRSTGMAFLHLGQHLHGVNRVTKGERHALIMWCRSSAYRAATCPCCQTFRRNGLCICSPEWN